MVACEGGSVWVVFRAAEVTTACGGRGQKWLWCGVGSEIVVRDGGRGDEEDVEGRRRRWVLCRRRRKEKSRKKREDEGVLFFIDFLIGMMVKGLS